MDNRLTIAVARADAAALAAKTMADLLAEINERTFGLEGRMTTFEQVDAVKSQARKELLETIIKNQGEADARQRKVDTKLAYYAGALVVISVVIEIASKVYFK